MPDCNEEARLGGIESIVRAVADFASIVEQQPVEFTLLWGASGAPSRINVDYSSQLMETALHVEGAGRRQPKVSGIVFPGLRKQVGPDSVLLAKIQVLLF